MPTSIILALNLLPYIGAIAAWVYAIFLTIRMRKAYLLRVTFWILLASTVVTTVVYGYRISHGNYINGPGCEGFSLFSCDADGDFFLGIWWSIISAVLLFMNIVLLFLAMRSNRRAPTKRK